MTDRDARLKRLRFRAWHRGTREADYIIGGFLDRFGAGWNDAELDWYEALLVLDDPPILAWVMQTEPVPDEWQGAMMMAMQRLDYVEVKGVTDRPAG